MKEIIKRVKEILLVLSVGGTIGFIMLLLVYMLPVNRMVQNANASIELFEKWGVRPQVVEGYEATSLDAYTDAWMLKIAFYDGDESVLQKSLNNYYYGYDDRQTRDGFDSIIYYLKGMEGYKKFSYARYWHGYQIILKPLLCFFDYADILEILKYVQLALAAACIGLLERKKLARCIPCMVVMLGCIEFHVVAMSMQFSWVFMISMLCSIYLLRKKDENVYDSSVELAFLVTGMCTSYFDFLTYPIFTLGIPLTIVLMRRNMLEQKGRLLFLTLLDSFYWAIGYGGMWFLKWILCTVFTDENMIADGIRTIMVRSGSNVSGVKVGYLEVLKENIWMIGKYPYALAVVGVAVLLLAGKGRFVKMSKEMMAAGLFVICLPFLWYAISKNHSYIHSFMTYRNLSITIFAGLCFLTQFKSPRGNDVAQRSFCDIIFSWARKKPSKENKTEQA